jgi:hypothetical protein
MLALGIFLLVALLLVLYCRLEHGRQNEGFFHGADWPDLPPLNYFTLQEPAYFFYDPEVKGSYETEPPEPIDDHRPDMNTVFGPNNYLRYYPPDN